MGLVRSGVPAGGGDTRTSSRRITGRPRGPAFHVVLLAIHDTLIPLGEYDVSYLLQLSSYILKAHGGPILKTYPPAPSTPGSCQIRRHHGPKLIAVGSPLRKYAERRDAEPLRAWPQGQQVPQAGSRTAQSKVSCSGGAGDSLRARGRRVPWPRPGRGRPMPCLSASSRTWPAILAWYALGA